MAANPDSNWWDENIGNIFDAFGNYFSQTFLSTNEEKYGDVLKTITEQPWPSFGSDMFQGIWTQVIAIAIALFILIISARIISFLQSREVSVITNTAEDSAMLLGYAFYGLVGLFLLTVGSDAISHAMTSMFFPDGIDAEGQPWYMSVLAAVGSIQDPMGKIIEKAAIDTFVGLFTSSLVVMQWGAILTLVFLPVWRTSLGNFAFRWSLALALTAIVAKPLVITFLAFSVKFHSATAFTELTPSSPMMPSTPSWTTIGAGLIILVTFIVLGAFIGKNPRMRSSRWKQIHADKLDSKSGFGVPAWGFGAGAAAVHRRASARRARAADKVRRTDGRLERTSYRANTVASAAKGAQGLVAKRAAAKAVSGVATKAASSTPQSAAILGAISATAAVIGRSAQNRRAMRATTDSRADRIRRSPYRM